MSCMTSTYSKASVLIRMYNEKPKRRKKCLVSQLNFLRADLAPLEIFEVPYAGLRKTMQIPEFCPKVFFYKIFSIAAFCCEPPKLETVLQALFVRNPNSFLWAIKCVKIKHPFQLRNAPKHIQVHRKFMAVNGNMFSKQLAKVSMNTTGCDEIQWRVSVTLKKRRKLTAFKEPYRTGTRVAREVYASVAYITEFQNLTPSNLRQKQDPTKICIPKPRSFPRKLELKNIKRKNRSDREHHSEGRSFQRNQSCSIRD